MVHIPLFGIAVRSELPGVSICRDEQGHYISRRNEFSNDCVDGSALIAQHEHGFNDPSGDLRGDQVDLRAARAVRIHRVGARLARSKMKPRRGITLAGLGRAIGHGEIDLREPARAIVVRHAHDSGHTVIRTLPHDPETVSAPEGGITAAVVVVGGPGHTAECKTKGRDHEDAFPKPAVHLFLLSCETVPALALSPGQGGGTIPLPEGVCLPAGLLGDDIHNSTGRAAGLREDYLKIT